MKDNKLTKREKEIVKPPANGKRPVRLSHPRLGTIQVQRDKILMAIARKHKVKVLVLSGKEADWLERSGSLEKFLADIDNKDFERVNKFYVLNWPRVYGFNLKTKVISFNNTSFTVQLTHPIKASVIKNRSL